MKDPMQVYTYPVTGRDGKQYGMRVLLDDLELAGMQAAGVVPLDVCLLVSIEPATDEDVAAMIGRALQ